MRLPLLLLTLCLIAMAGTASATTVIEQFEPSATPGNDGTGTYLITPTEKIWAFGVGNDNASDTSISGIAFIDGLRASRHWISKIISRSTWEAGVNWEASRPIGASPPSSFSIDTTTVAWQWGTANRVTFYHLYEAGDSPGDELAVLQPGTQYDAFKYFADAPNSTFAAFNQADGGPVQTGEVILQIVPEPASASLLLLGLGALAVRRRR